MFYLGTIDALVGDAEFAGEQAEAFPNVEIVVMPSGLLVAVEKKDTVNAEIR